MRSEPGSEPAVFDPMAEMPNFWDLTDRELAKSCRLMAEGQAMGTSGLTSAEAMRLSLVWNDAFNSPTRSGEEREKRAALIQGLRKRTIQILVRLCIAPATRAH
jgi:hypothetical protein